MRRIALYAVWVAVGAVLVSPAIAQQYQADEVDEQAARLSAFMTSWVRDPARYATDKERFSEYFSKAYFPSMTQHGPDDLEELGDLRYKLFNDVLWSSRSEALRTDLTKIAYDAVIKLIPNRNPNYHPSARYNAILILGMLDEVYGDDRANRKPKPLPTANSYLVNVVSAAAQGKNVPPHLLVGTLIGLERHARFHESLDRQKLAAMSAAVIELLSNDPPLSGLDRDVSEWIQLSAASVLAHLGSPGANGKVHQALLDLIAGQDMTLDSRCRLVALLKLINYDGAAVDGRATADRVFQLAVDVGQAEAERAKEFEDLQIGGGFGRVRNNSRRRRMNFDDGPEGYDRRTLLTRLGDLETGLVAVKPLVPDDRRSTVDTILSAIKTVVAEAKNDSAIDLDVVGKMRETAQAIEQAVNPAAAPAAEQPLDEF